MKRILFIKAMFFLLIAASTTESFCQYNWNLVKEAKDLPLVNNRATVKGYSFDKTLYISKDSLKKGFSIALQDESYKIVFFNFYYECNGCDIWVTTIYGNEVTLKNASILKWLKAGEVLGCSLFKINKGGKSFTVPEFSIVLTD